MKTYFENSDLKISTLWHCFGNKSKSATLDEALKMVALSKTNLIPINTHRLNVKKPDIDSLEIGFSGIFYKDLFEQLDRKEEFHLMLNINHAITSEEAYTRTVITNQLSQLTLIKLEVLDKNMANSNDKELIIAYERLMSINKKFIIYPLISNNYNTAKELIYMGCPLLRVMGSPIGSGLGILDSEEFKNICELNTPVVLDGGIGSFDHFKLGMDLGAKGGLINSMMFKPNLNPLNILNDFMSEYDNFNGKY